MFLEKRYSESNRMIMAFITIVSALLIHIGVSLYAGAVVFEYFFNIPVVVSIIVIAVITTIYTVLGGLKAIVVTDSIQAVLLLLGAVLLTTMAIFALPEIAGVENFAQFKEALKPDQFSMLHTFRNPATGKLNEFSYVSVLLGYPILGIWYWCTDQTIVQKSLGARTQKDAQLGAVFAGVLKILPLFFMVLPGVVAYVLFRDKIGEDNNMTLLVLIQEILPVGMRGLFAAGLLAAVMSTVESALNSTATVTAEDICKKIWPNLEDKKLVLIGRITAVVVIVLAILWSPYCGRFKSIFEAINKIPMMFAPAVTCVFILGVFWKRGTKQAALATFIFGSVVGIVYFIADLPREGQERLIADVWGIPFMQVGWWLFVMCCIVYVIVSFMTTAPTEEDLAKIGWEPPLRIITKDKITGITDPRVASIGLFILMITMYIILK